MLVILITSKDIFAANGREKFIIELKFTEKCPLKLLLNFQLNIYSDCTFKKIQIKEFLFYAIFE